MEANRDYVVLISANAEWREVKKLFPDCKPDISPYGEWFEHNLGGISGSVNPVIFAHGGWGKVAAAGSTQYAIDRWHPRLIINLGTCGGFEDEIKSGDVILVEKTIIYDIFEQMGDPAEHIRHYMAELDSKWLTDPLPHEVIRTVLVSGDRDLFPEDVPMLKSKYGAIAGDWESGAIAWVTTQNHTQCLILRGVSDLVGKSGGEAYLGKVGYYYENAATIMKELVEQLPLWLSQFISYYSR